LTLKKVPAVSRNNSSRQFFFQSSLDFEECVHKLMKMNLKAGHETELCHMVIGEWIDSF
jgi:hypothetical protein